MNGHLGVKPLSLFTYIVLLRRFVPQPFIFSAEVQFPFTSFNCILIISFLDSLVLRLGILIHIILSSFPLRLTRVTSRILTAPSHIKLTPQPPTWLASLL
jgi:hypothetical protein